MKLFYSKKNNKIHISITREQQLNSNNFQTYFRILDNQNIAGKFTILDTNKK